MVSQISTSFTKFNSLNENRNSIIISFCCLRWLLVETRQKNYKNLRTKIFFDNNNNNNNNKWIYYKRIISIKKYSWESGIHLKIGLFGYEIEVRS